MSLIPNPKPEIREAIAELACPGTFVAAFVATFVRMALCSTKVVPTKLRQRSESGLLQLAPEPNSNSQAQMSKTPLLQGVSCLRFQSFAFISVHSRFLRVSSVPTTLSAQEIRNSKSETNSKSQAQMFKTPPPQGALSLGSRSFVLIRTTIHKSLRSLRKFHGRAPKRPFPSSILHPPSSLVAAPPRCVHSCFLHGPAHGPGGIDSGSGFE